MLEGKGGKQEEKERREWDNDRGVKREVKLEKLIKKGEIMMEVKKC